MINNVVIVSGVQQSDSVMHIHVSILFQILFPFRLLHNIEQSFLCYTVGPCWLSILNIATIRSIDQSFSFPFLRVPFGTATLVNSLLSLSFLEIFHQCKHQGPGTKKPFSTGFC